MRSDSGSPTDSPFPSALAEGEAPAIGASHEKPVDPSQIAAFFDVDGTLVDSNITHYYAFFRTREWHSVLRWLWLAAFLFRGIGYLVLDRLDRGRFNVFFYRNYRGMSVQRLSALSEECFQRVMHPRMFPDAAKAVAAHRAMGHQIVLVTGSLDFITTPLARTLGATFSLATRLKCNADRYTGEIDGVVFDGRGKSRLILAYAQEHNVDLQASFAYSDSVADLEMLESVGSPIAVNPDHRLARLALIRGWPIQQWRRRRR